MEGGESVKRILLLALALLAGCATPEYWRAGMFTPVPGPAHIVYTSEMPAGFCDNEALACWIPHTAFVYMLDTLMPSEETCYTHHEVEMPVSYTHLTLPTNREV